jgi:hypothetical protein
MNKNWTDADEEAIMENQEMVEVAFPSAREAKRVGLD